MMMMMMMQEGNIFVYMGGDQVVPINVSRVRIHTSVKIIPHRAFKSRQYLIDVEFHDEVETVCCSAFQDCRYLTGIKLPGVKIIGSWAFLNCIRLADVEFGDKLETIGGSSFNCCTSLKSITLPSSLKTIRGWAFYYCDQLMSLDLPEGLETVEDCAFKNCNNLRRITMPLKDGIILYGAFDSCPRLSTIELVGGTHETIFSLHMESWINEINDEINRINRVLPKIPPSRNDKTATIQQWIESAVQRLEHYKAEHKALLREATTLLELALWKAKLDEKEMYSLGGVKSYGVNIPTVNGRNKYRITSGAIIVIKNVLPFLQLK